MSLQQWSSGVLQKFDFYGSFTRLKKKAKQKNLTSNNNSLVVFIWMPPKGVSLDQEHEKSNCWAEKKVKTIIGLSFFALIWSYCPDSVCQTTKCWSEIVFSDNQLQIQEISPSSCHTSEQKVTLAPQGVTRTGMLRLVSSSFIHPNLKQVSEVGFPYLSLPWLRKPRK